MCYAFFLNTASLQTSVTNTEIQNITIDFLFHNKLSSASQYAEKALFHISQRGYQEIRNLSWKLHLQSATRQFLSIDRLAGIESMGMQIIKQLKG